MIVNELVTDAIYLSLQDREHQPVVNSGYVQLGLKRLIDILDQWRDKIPYAGEFLFNDVSDLTNTNFVEVDNVNFIINQTQNPLEQLARNAFYQAQNVRNLTGIPTIYYFDELNKTIQVYPTPTATPYQFSVWGRPDQSNLALFNPLPSNMPRFQITALLYELAFRLCSEYGVEWDDKKESLRQNSLNMLDAQKVVDVRPFAQSVFGRPSASKTPPFPYFYYLSGGGQ